jgi:hypothetical protein
MRYISDRGELLLVAEYDGWRVLLHLFNSIPSKAIEFESANVMKADFGGCTSLPSREPTDTLEGRGMAMEILGRD